jgi:hypothetical protein
MSGSSSQSSSADNRIAATDQAIVVTGKGTNVGAGAVSQGAKSKILASGATDLSGNKGQVGGTAISGTKGSVSISSSDPAVAQQAIAANAILASQFGQTLADFLKTSGQQNADNTAALASAIKSSGGGGSSPVILSTASGDTSATSTAPAPWWKNKIVIGVAAALGLGAVIWIFKRRK